MWLHGIRNKLYDRHNDSIPKLSVGLRIRNVLRDKPFPFAMLKPHEASALLRGESPRSWARLIYQNLRSILVVTCRESSRDIIGPTKSEAETIALGFMFGLVTLQILPETRGKRVFGIDFAVRVENRSDFWIGFGQL